MNQPLSTLPVAPLLDLQVEAKSFGTTPVLGQIDLQLQPGEIVSLLGPRGCGKAHCCGWWRSLTHTSAAACTGAPSTWVWYSRNPG